MKKDRKITEKMKTIKENEAQICFVKASKETATMPWLQIHAGCSFFFSQFYIFINYIKGRFLKKVTKISLFNIFYKEVRRVIFHG